MTNKHVLGFQYLLKWMPGNTSPRRCSVKKKKGSNSKWMWQKCHTLVACLVISLEHINGSEKSYQKTVFQRLPNLFGHIPFFCSSCCHPYLKCFGKHCRVNKLVLKSKCCRIFSWVKYSCVQFLERKPKQNKNLQVGRRSNWELEV